MNTIIDYMNLKINIIKQSLNYIYFYIWIINKRYDT